MTLRDINRTINARVIKLLHSFPQPINTVCYFLHTDETVLRGSKIISINVSQNTDHNSNGMCNEVREPIKMIKLARPECNRANMIDGNVVSSKDGEMNQMN